jgi:hypothetical protein
MASRLLREAWSESRLGGSVAATGSGSKGDDATAAASGGRKKSFRGAMASTGGEHADHGQTLHRPLLRSVRGRPQGPSRGPGSLEGGQPRLCQLHGRGRHLKNIVCVDLHP